jgi:hypothetical protein
MLEEKLNMYRDTFGDSFPTYPLCLTRSDEEIIKIIDRCLDEGSTVYELGYLKEDDDIQY